MGIRLLLAGLLTLLSAAPLAAQGTALSYENVLDLKRMGFSDTELLAELERTGTRLALTPAQLATLRAAGAGEALLGRLRGGGTGAAGLPGEVLAWHRGGRGEAEIIAALVRRGRPRPHAMAALLPLVQGGVPHAVLLALRGTPLSLADVRLLHQRRASVEALQQLAPYLGLAFAVDPSTALALRRAGVPTAWIAALGRRGGTADPLEPAPEDAPRVRRYPATPALDATLVKHVNIGRLYELPIPRGWHAVSHSHTTGFSSTVFTPFANVPAAELPPVFVLVTYEVFDRNDAILSLPLDTLGQRMMRLNLAEHPRLAEDPARRTRHRVGGQEVPVAHVAGRMRHLPDALVGRYAFVRAGRVVFTIAASCRTAERATYEPLFDRLLAGFQPTPPSSRAPKRREKPLSTFEVTGKYKKSIVMIRAESASTGGTGSGFIVREDGYILTNHHVVYNAKAKAFHRRLTVHWDDSLDLPPRKARLVAAFIGADRSYDIAGVDLALLKIEGRGYTRVPLTPVKSIELGDPILTLGYPKTSFFSGISLFVTNGVVTRINRLPDGSVNSLFINAKITNGNSGGPCFDLMTGGVIGLNTWVAREGTRHSFQIYGYNGVIPIDHALERFPQLLTYPPGALKKMTGAQHLELGGLYLAQGRHYAAESEFRQALESAPNDAAAWVGLAECLWDKKGADDEAAEALRKASHFVRDRRADLHVLEYLGYLRLSEGRARDCLALADRVERLEPGRWVVHELRGRAHAKLGQQAQARRELALARERLQDLSPAGYIASGEVAYDSGDLEGGRALFEAARKKFPESLRVQLGYIEYFERKRRPAEAAALCERLAHTFRTSPELFARWGRLLGELGKHADALAAYRRSAQLYSDRPAPATIHAAIGRAALGAGNLVEAIKGFIAALRVDHRSRRAVPWLCGMAETFSRASDGPAGADWAFLALARTIQPDHADVKRLASRIQSKVLVIKSVSWMDARSFPPALIAALIAASGTRYDVSAASARTMVKKGVHPLIADALLAASRGSTPKPTPKPVPRPPATTAGVQLVSFKIYADRERRQVRARVTLRNTTAFGVDNIRYLTRVTDTSGKELARKTWLLTDVHLLPAQQKPLTVPLFDLADLGQDKLKAADRFHMRILDWKRAK